MATPSATDEVAITTILKFNLGQIFESTIIIYDENNMA